jgi:aryl-alcohol dehydrogenase-like predicted oxidoreductase
MTTNDSAAGTAGVGFRTLGRTGLAVSSLGFGGSPIGCMDTDQAAVTEVLNELLDHGVSLIDTAHVYYGSEEAIGSAVGHRRGEYVLVSKCGSKYTDDDLPPIWTPEYISATIDRSLQRLRTDHIDVMLLHSCDLETLQRGEALGAVVAARDAGKVRFAGYSGDNETAAWAAAHPDIAVIQTSLSLCDQRNIDEVLPVTTANDCGVMAKRPLANAAWKGLEGQYERYRKYARPYHERFDAMKPDLAAIREAAGEAIEWPEIALRFTLALPISTAIVGTTRPASVRANLAAASKGPLADAACALIRETFGSTSGSDAWMGLQ